VSLDREPGPELKKYEDIGRSPGAGKSTSVTLTKEKGNM